MSSVMGTWGTGLFDDDDAADWAWELQESADLSVVRRALEAIDRKTVYLEAPECAVALAAAEIVAGLCGRPAQGLPEEVSAWIAAHDSLPAAPLQSLAKRVAERVLGDSELAELWRESDEWNGWSANVSDLLRRLA
jgi:hypothetical protein